MVRYDGIMSFCNDVSQESGSEGQFLADLHTERVKLFTPMVSFYFAVMVGCH